MRRILVVDDNPVDSLLVEEAVAQSGLQDFIIECAEDGDQALAALRRVSPDPLVLVLLDMHLPKGGESVIVQELRSNPAFSQTRVVTWTFALPPWHRETFSRLGVHDHLAKPVRLADYERFQERIKNMLTLDSRLS